jgi:hypothetical protein
VELSSARVHISRCDREVDGVVFACEFARAIDCSRRMCRRIGDNVFPYRCDNEHFRRKALAGLSYEACSGSQSVKLAGDNSCLRVCVKVCEHVTYSSY